MFMLPFGKRKKIILICFLFNVVLEWTHRKFSVFFITVTTVGIKTRAITSFRRGGKIVLCWKLSRSPAVYVSNQSHAFG